MKKATIVGFTLVEIMFVVAIIGLLASIGLPAMLKISQKARAKRFVRDITTASHIFEQYVMDEGTYPPETGPSEIPAGMAVYLVKFPWVEDTVIGGQWDWEYNQAGIRAGIGAVGVNLGDDEMAKVDDMIDDGDLGSGLFRKSAKGYIYIIE